MITKIKGTVKDYEWGSVDYLPSLFGYEKTGHPQAEAWFGTHSSGDSLLEDGTTLSSLIAKDSEHLLGKSCVEKFGTTLPLLLKVLAINSPLSIQCHPTREIAKAGWAKEATLREKGTPKANLNYQDDNQKAEVLYALTPVTAMCGFRRFEDIKTNLELVIPTSYKKYFLKEENIGSLFKHLYTMDKSNLSEIVEELVASVKTLPSSPDKDYLNEKEVVLTAYALYGIDPGLLCPFLLNVLHLAPGEAVFLKPRILHAYVKGNGVELMSLSDNVLRGGLTHKKIDVEELMSVMIADSSDASKCVKKADAGGRIEVVTPTDDFTLFELPSGAYKVKKGRSSLLLCVKGKASAGEQNLKSGDCVFISADNDDYEISVDGLAFQAEVPEDKEI